ncbi:unnamed protein product [Tuber melanosporum]|uniref:(Perigord truffle) hypothetical protein n=1 Tax=Tuber melanosporum (strain Mel28) TaxID=656061 RepID=D5GHU6_TUBMM|nr:uncharacterized protein GSTUM_00008121001 [Tuber melanosporum]CAZ84089.1 unnamed protein product [Tuber melanosporum]
MLFFVTVIKSAVLKISRISANTASSLGSSIVHISSSAPSYF